VGDLVCNRPFKVALQEAFNEFLGQKYKEHTEADGIFSVDLRISAMRPMAPMFVSRGVKRLKTPKMRNTIKEAFYEKALLREARALDVDDADVPHCNSPPEGLEQRDESLQLNAAYGIDGDSAKICVLDVCTSTSSCEVKPEYDGNDNGVEESNIDDLLSNLQVKESDDRCLILQPFEEDKIIERHDALTFSGSDISKRRLSLDDIRNLRNQHRVPKHFFSCDKKAKHDGTCGFGSLCICLMSIYMKVYSIRNIIMMLVEAVQEDWVKTAIGQTIAEEEYAAIASMYEGENGGPLPPVKYLKQIYFLIFAHKLNVNIVVFNHDNTGSFVVSDIFAVDKNAPTAFILHHGDVMFDPLLPIQGNLFHTYDILEKYLTIISKARCVDHVQQFPTSTSSTSTTMTSTTSTSTTSTSKTSTPKTSTTAKYKGDNIDFGVGIARSEDSGHNFEGSTTSRGRSVKSRLPSLKI
jgi:hypothetical protein